MSGPIVLGNLGFLEGHRHEPVGFGMHQMAELCTFSVVIPRSDFGSLFKSFDESSCGQCIFCVTVELQNVRKSLGIVVYCDSILNCGGVSHCFCFCIGFSVPLEAVARTVQASL